MDDYTHHVFVSYRRLDDEWLRWTHQNFVRAVRSLLRPAVPNLSIYTDQDLETGERWPDALASELAMSRLMVPILSRDYFESNWCRMELAHMHQRERVNDKRAYRLILPVIIDDGDCFPEVVRELQGEKLHDLANPFTLPNSKGQEELAGVLKRRLCPVIEKALKGVPPYNPAWKDLATEQFEGLFRINAAAQNTVPTMFPLA